MEMSLLVLCMATLASYAYAQPGKCVQTPINTKTESIDSKLGPFQMWIETKGRQGKYLPDQTYVLILESVNATRPFREFMITVEDLEVDNNPFRFDHRSDVGTLKTLGEDAKSRYSERCSSTVENTDNSDKHKIVTHWVSPKAGKKNQKIRFRAMVAENKEAWYEGENLTQILEKDDAKPLDSPPYDPNPNCNICSEARYEVIFKGEWSRGRHPRHYPNKPDDNGYSHLIGASHDINYILWQQNVPAGPGLQQVAEEANVTLLQQSIISSMSESDGTRTLIRGARRHHPHMSEYSHALFRVDRIHHLFSVVVAMRPSPDWFLGTSRFELCTEDGWLNHSEIPLYPWDAGTMEGISYDTTRTMTQPINNVERVAVGSFDPESPFYQMNLNDLKSFAHLEVRRLNVYPLASQDCSDAAEETSAAVEETVEAVNEAEDYDPKPNDAPLLATSRLNYKCLSEWSEWSRCEVEADCGPGTQFRLRYEEDQEDVNSDQDVTQMKQERKCHKGIASEDASMMESRPCYVSC